LFLLFSDEDFRGVPPSIATLATLIEETIANRRNRRGDRSIDYSTEGESFVAWNYSTSVFASLTNRLWIILSLATKDDVDGRVGMNQYDNDPTTPVNTKKNKFGFRSSNRSVSRQSSMSLSPMPIATYFWMIVNIGLFLLYWQRHVPVTKVALNSQLLSAGDLGRALTGNLSHFDMWHLFFNMMSTSALGSDMALERSLGTIPFFLLTVSWIPLTTIAVVALQWIKSRWICRESAVTSTVESAMVSSFPNMVGFSGVLFAWMVIATLQTQQKSCPVFFLPDLCFDVYEIGGFTVSVAPLIQLVVLQMVLPRASFVGHLAGIFVGFLFHCRAQPSLEWSQPCLLFPFTWFVGKLLSLKYFGSTTNSGGSATSDQGRVLGSGPSGSNPVPWRTNIRENHNNNNNEDDVSAALWLLFFLTVAIVTLAGLLLCTARLMNPHNCLVVSALVLAAFLTAFTTACRSTNGVVKIFGQDFTVGMLGRAYVVIVLVQCVTDSMTLAGWMVTSPVWRNKDFSFGWMLLPLWMFRITIWIASLFVVCHVLCLLGHLHENSEISVWMHALGWWVVKPCVTAGKNIASILGERNIGSSGDISDTQLHMRDSTSKGNTLRGRVVSEVV
jgi:membrane associated rhomboid family serine protease